MYLRRIKLPITLLTREYTIHQILFSGTLKDHVTSCPQCINSFKISVNCDCGMDIEDATTLCIYIHYNIKACTSTTNLIITIWMFIKFVWGFLLNMCILRTSRVMIAVWVLSFYCDSSTSVLSPRPIILMHTPYKK